MNSVYRTKRIIRVFYFLKIRTYANVFYFSVRVSSRLATVTKITLISRLRSYFSVFEKGEGRRFKFGTQSNRARYKIETSSIPTARGYTRPVCTSRVHFSRTQTDSHVYAVKVIISRKSQIPLS